LAIVFLVLELKLQLVLGLGLHKSNQINTFINSFGYAPTAKCLPYFGSWANLGLVIFLPGNFGARLWSSGDRLSIKLLFSISNLSFAAAAICPLGWISGLSLALTWFDSKLELGYTLSANARSLGWTDWALPGAN